MSDTISRALERSRTEHKVRRLTGKQPARDRAFPSARVVDVSQQAMERSRIIAALEDQRVIDCYQLLRARVLRRLQHTPAALGVTSAVAREGKTLTAINLAVSIAMGEPSTVLLVDGDVRRPAVAEAFGIEVNAGLGDYLLGEASLEEVLLRPPIDGLVLLPGRTGTGVRPEVLSSDRLYHLLAEVKELNPHGLIIFDLPPALAGGDVVAFTPHLDGTLVVVADGRTSQQALNRALPLLEEAKVIGAVLNQTDEAVDLGDYYGY